VGYRPFVIAIDGPAASGKGTLARRLAERFALARLDTGTLYRATALLVLDAAGDPAARGAVLDGRDIGTIVCPQADVKLFITASTEARAARRAKELREQGAPAIYENVLQDLNERDARDSGRRAAPLKAAHDAHVIDTTTLDADVVFERVCALVARALKEKEWQQ